MASTSHGASSTAPFIVQIIGQAGPLRQGKQSINTKGTFHDAFTSMDFAVDHRLVRVEILSSLNSEALPYQVESLYTFIEDENFDLQELAGITVRAIRFFVEKDAKEGS
jgi:hypothetical protein